MISFTDVAKKRFEDLAKGKDLNVFGVRLPSNDGAYFDIEWLHLGEVGFEETFIEVGGVMFIFEKKVKPQIDRAKIDYVPGGILPGKFQIEFPEVTEQGAVVGADFSNPTVKKIQELLDNEINPSIASHGGTARIYDYKDNVLYLQFGGGCHGCGMVDATLKQGIEVRMKEVIPELIAVKDQTDHTTGANPYFPPQAQHSH